MIEFMKNETPENQTESEVKEKKSEEVGSDKEQDGGM